MSQERRIKQWATGEGFDLVAITHADADIRAQKGLETAIENQWYGQMTWLKDTADRRAAPRSLWANAQSIIMLGMNYGPDINPLSQLPHKNIGLISAYARHRDYHDVVKGKLKQIAGKMVSKLHCKVKVFVDTAPVMEKPLAQRAGLGWQGKHTNLVSDQFGSWLFLGAIFTDLVLKSDKAETDHCGSCKACLNICPTQAFPAPYQLDANKCISYLTIEYKDPIPTRFRTLMGNRIYGCDDCLAVCPWNKFAQTTAEAKLVARNDLMAPSLKQLAKLDDTAFKQFFSGSPIKRTGRTCFIRNVLIAMGNSGIKHWHLDVLPHIHDPHPIVRGAAVWALSQLVDEHQFTMYRSTFIKQEKDTYVLDEWHQNQIK